MTDIVLTTLNARYYHSSFSLRYLYANLGELQPRATILEFGLNDGRQDVLAALLEHNPRIVGFSVYIWNVELATRLLADLKRVRPDVQVVLGGPEVSYETEGQPIVELADYVITGEGDLAFAELCRQLLDNCTPLQKLIHAAVPALDDIALPYSFYNEEDIARRVIYVEASRGCPFTCEFCLSALEIPVRQFPLDRFLAAMLSLIERGVRQFKFVDRTFNLNLRVSQAILAFFLQHWQPDMFLHFEMIPDRLPEPLRQLIVRFPAGSLQFEIGVQTFNTSTGELISRRQDIDQLISNFQFLRDHTQVHIHADLIVGLPGEDIDSFGDGFDRLLALQPQEIQVGILKRLRGTPITRHDVEFGMVYSPHPPYEILCNKQIDFSTMQRLRRFAKYWDMIGNSGNFTQTCRLMFEDAVSPFQNFMALSDWIFARERQMHGIPLIRLAEHVFDWLVREQQHADDLVASTIFGDYIRGGRRDRPAFLNNFDLPPVMSVAASSSSAPPRQSRHAEGAG